MNAAEEITKKGLGVDWILTNLLSDLSGDNPVNLLIDLAEALDEMRRIDIDKDALVDELLQIADIVSAREGEIAQMLETECQGQHGVLSQVFSEIDEYYWIHVEGLDEHIYEAAEGFIEEQFDAARHCPVCSCSIDFEDDVREERLHKSLARAKTDISELQHKIHERDRDIVELEVVARGAVDARAA